MIIFVETEPKSMKKTAILSIICLLAIGCAQSNEIIVHTDNGSKVTFEGSLEPKTSGLHNFYIYYAGYTKVYVDDAEVVPEIWRTAWNPNGRKFALDMDAGRKYKLTVKWEPDGGVSYNALRVLTPVPNEQRSRMSWWGEMQNGIEGVQPKAVEYTGKEITLKI